MSPRTFVTAINCMDGRVQLPIIEWMKHRYKAEYVDMITEPGPIKVLADNKPADVVASLKTRTGISVNKHGSSCIAVIGHGDCAGNPVGKDVQLQQLEKAKHTVQSWGFTASIIGLWVDEQWTVHHIF
ncbi:MAG: hypothetical protein JXA00_03305 [Candidatus Thermoplasmatota archaeon]|nr:hypothetical protein [Candidatus Thermoplasmatota archaeon]